VKKNNYEDLIVDMIKRGVVLDHSKSPCEENFIPDKKVTTVMLDIADRQLNVLLQFTESFLGLS
jgi:hypothetical protein